MSSVRSRLPVFRFLGRHRVTILVAVLVSLVSSGTAAAVSYVVLGGVNSTAKTTTIKSSINGAALQLTNTNAVGGTSATGLKITVPAGRAPITVDATAGKATNLNADKLDGIDSADLARGTNVTTVANRLVLGNGDSNVALLTLPGLGVLRANCYANDTTASIYYANTTGSSVDMWENSAETASNAAGDEHSVGNGVANAASVSYAAIYPNQYSSTVAWWDKAAFSGDGGQFGDTLVLGQGNSPGARKTATVTLSVYRSASGAPCGVQAMATLWSTP
jgi:hypothetical protein